MENTITAFSGEHMFASGPAGEVALAVKATQDLDNATTVLIFDDLTGRQVDFDLRGSNEEILGRLKAKTRQPEEKSAEEQPTEGPVAGESRRSSGRPKLGVVAREITLLPRHWEWLGEQPGGASVTLRKLVDAARKAAGGQVSSKQAQQAADRFMGAMLGNQPGYEEATRALYAGNRDRFLALSKDWPADLRDHARKLAKPAFVEDGSAT
ncbi:hypothetical protein ASD44_16835 [Mesorhizobium sp. Root554]|uniref:DUF2239 family protein n=1 Tax=unclassified Mesorhizobium TaxID=325217 RepID=UPI0006F6DC14|nr:MULTISPECIES: DUF2239 family protein [unclassified Mesorhizobium]KQZ15535.1 hypothetical protein ASD27_16840 [Mesorhizobium sp. Root1471]KQZ38044.1 hypothetical protein ASD44_16835 [Mesorhizobium sp. Root554]